MPDRLCHLPLERTDTEGHEYGNDVERNHPFEHHEGIGAGETMSFEVIIVGFNNGQERGFPKQIILDAFPFAEVSEEGTAWGVKYDGAKWVNLSVQIDKRDRSFCTSLSVDRPPPDVRLFDSLFSILQKTDSILIWPDSKAMLVGHGDMAAHVSPDIFEYFKKLIVVESGQSIIDHIRQNS